MRIIRRLLPTTNYPLPTRAGFTLLEVLVASSILVLVAGSVLTLGRSSLRGHELALERSQAFELAQEGLEIVRQIRDTSFVDREGSNWESIFPAPAAATSYGLRWDPLARRWQLAQANQTDPVIDNGAEEIPLDGTTYQRRVVIDQAAANLLPIRDPGGAVIDQAAAANIRKVTVTVSWQSQGQPRSVTATTMLSNWPVGL